MEFDIFWMVVDINEQMGSHFASLLGVKDGNDKLDCVLPAVRILDPAPGERQISRYEYNQGDLSLESLKRYVLDFKEGKLKKG